MRLAALLPIAPLACLALALSAAAPATADADRPRAGITSSVGLSAKNASDEWGSDKLPLGTSDLPETRTTARLAPGVSYTKIVRGQADPDDSWTVTIKIAGALLGPRDDATELATDLTDAGFSPDVHKVDHPDYAGEPSGALGWRVRVGAYSSKSEATAANKQLKASGFTGTVVWTGEDGDASTGSTGPWRVQVVRVDRAALPQVRASYGDSVGTAETTSSISAADRAMAAVNAGFFIVHDTDGYPGAPSGIGVYNGKLSSEAVNGRAALTLDGKRARIAPLRSSITVRSRDGARREIDGVDRKPGLIHLCGGVGGDQPTELPRHSGGCTDPSELILDNHELGTDVTTGPGVQASLDRHGKVTSLGDLGGQVPVGGRLLQGTGDAAEWLRVHAQPGTKLQVVSRLTDNKGATIHTSPGTSIVGGGPILVRHGSRLIDARAEGDSLDDTPSFVYSFGMRRNPRTMVGIDAEGGLLLVTADGRQPGYSIGLSFTEQADVMRSLGAVSAMNLDGGGSTTMTVDSQVTNSPTDATGERPVGDVLEVLPPARHSSADSPR